jgi:2'-5' RNA ligase
MSTAKMYFLAVVAPAHINAQALKWKHYMREHYGCVVALRTPAHLTLIPPFWMDMSLEKELMADADAFAAQHHSLDITLKNFDAFKPRVIFVGIEKNDALQELKSSLEDHLLALDKYPIKKESRPFHPHLTIANRDLLKKDFAPAFAHLSKIEYEEKFTANGISLMRHNGTEWDMHHYSPLRH